ncbi:MAG TPA: Fic family protein [Polyangia bacterium]|jgi:hypothetical protein
MFEEVEARRERLATYKPFSAEMRQRLDAVFEPYFIYGSNALEGNTLSLGDTFYIVREGKLPGGKREEEYLEVKGQQDAYSYLRDAATGQVPLSEKLIREFHELLTQKLDAEKYRPGKYKSHDNQVWLSDGSLFSYVSHLDTPAAMRGLVAWYLGDGQTLHPVERAAGLHYRFALIHPFQDGNGRTARLLANLALLQAGHVMAIFRADNERRRAYLDALDAVTKSVPANEVVPDNPRLNLFPFVAHLEQDLLSSYDVALDVVEGRLAISAEDVVRRFETLEQRLLPKLGIAQNEKERLASNARLVHELTDRIRTSVDAVARVGRGWTELALETGSFKQGARDTLDVPPPLSFAKRRLLLAMDDSARGETGVVTIQLKRRAGSLVQLDVPLNWCEFVIWAEPHELTVGCLRISRPLIPADLAGTGALGRSFLRVPLDPRLWRADEIDRFVATEANRFLESMESAMSAGSLST